MTTDKPKTTRKPRSTKPQTPPIDSQPTTAVKQIDAVFPPKFAPLFEPHRFKVLYGGRGSAKSWSIARALLLIGQKYKVRVLCCREIQQSISASVHKLLSDQIYALGLEAHYIIERAKIYSPVNDTEFLFAGLRDNVSQIKSYESLNIVWVEEAQNVSELSWDTLIPTMRAEGFIPGTDSEVWCSFNPLLEQDNSYQRWVVSPPDEAWVCQANYTDNPWFPDALRREMERMKKQDYDKYLHIYEGQCRKFLEGAVYVNELKLAEEEDRITKVGHDPTQPVQAFFDLGYADATGIWIAQKCGPHIRVLKYIEGSRKGLDFYLKELSLLPYAIDHIHLPHDARQKTVASPMSIESLIKAKGYRVSIVPNLSIADGINAVRALFPTMHFDKRGCGEGIHHLRHYRFEVKENNGGLKDMPVHDSHSHCADSTRYMCIALRAPKEKPDLAKYLTNDPWARFSRSSTSWMNI